MIRAFAEHLARWDENSEAESMDGVLLSKSMLSFLSIAAAEKDDTDDPRTVLDFPMVKLHPCWLHDPPERVTRMDMCSLMDTLEALEWHVFSDISFHGRTPAWWKQVLDLAKLVFHRCFHFLQYDNWDLSVLNMEEYRDVRRANMMAELFSRNGGADYGIGDMSAERLALMGSAYDSEDEGEGGRVAGGQRKRVRGAYDEAESSEILRAFSDEGLQTRRASVSDAWLYDIDTVFSHFWLEAYDHEAHLQKHPNVATLPVDISRLRAFLFEFATSVKDTEVIRYRRIWEEELLVTSSHRRVFKRVSPFTVKAAAREIIVSKRDEIYPSPCTSVADITTKLAQGDVNRHLRISTDALLCLHSSSLSLTTGDVCKALCRESRRAVLADLRPPNLVYPCIYRDRVLNRWEIACTPAVFLYATSLAASLATLRKWMRENGVSPVLREVSVDVYDQYFFDEPR